MDQESADAPEEGGALFHVSTEVVAEKDRLAFWEELLCAAFIPVQLQALDEGPFHCEATSFCTRQLSVTRIVATPQRNFVGSGGEEGGQFVLAMPRNRSRMFYKGEGEFEVASGDIVVIGPACKGTAGLLGERSCDVTVWTVPRAALEAMGGVPVNDARLLSASHGPGALIAMYMQHLSDRLPSLDPLTRDLLDRQFTQLVALALGIKSELLDLSRDSVREAQLHRLLAYVSAHLYDPALSPRTVAGALGISVRYLHLLFEPKGVSFSEWVRERRLQEAHRILTSAAGMNQSVSNVAYACGFGNLSAFYRCYRARYGMTPKEAQRKRHESGGV